MNPAWWQWAALILASACGGVICAFFGWVAWILALVLGMFWAIWMIDT